MKKTILLILFCLAALPVLEMSNVEAKRVIPKSVAKTTVKTGTTSTASGSRVGIKVKFRSDRRAIVVNFTNLTAASKVQYTLSYNALTGAQGVSGSIATTENSAQRELIFGTCSNGVCRYDTKITNAVLTVRSTLTNGKVVVKNFKIKV